MFKEDGAIKRERKMWEKNLHRNGMAKNAIMTCRIEKTGKKLNRLFDVNGMIRTNDAESIMVRVKSKRHFSELNEIVYLANFHFGE